MACQRPGMYKQPSPLCSELSLTVSSTVLQHIRFVTNNTTMPTNAFQMITNMPNSPFVHHSGRLFYQHGDEIVRIHVVHDFQVI